jgi:hypothetical protein
VVLAVFGAALRVGAHAATATLSTSKVVKTRCTLIPEANATPFFPTWVSPEWG